jgi:hypothetical protein
MVLGKKTDFNPAMAEFYDRYFVPVTKFFERFVHPPFGKNIIIIAERATLKQTSYGDLK